MLQNHSSNWGRSSAHSSKTKLTSSPADQREGEEIHSLHWDCILGRSAHHPRWCESRYYDVHPSNLSQANGLLMHKISTTSWLPLSATVNVVWVIWRHCKVPLGWVLVNSRIYYSILLRCLVRLPAGMVFLFLALGFKQSCQLQVFRLYKDHSTRQLWKVCGSSHQFSRKRQSTSSLEQSEIIPSPVPNEYTNTLLSWMNTYTPQTPNLACSLGNLVLDISVTTTSVHL